MTGHAHTSPASTAPTASTASVGGCSCGAALFSRRHVDLGRLSTSLCRPGT